MARSPAKKASKSVGSAKAKKPTLKQLIARTNTIADKVAELLGELRQLDQKGFVITTLVSGKSKQL
ncbi:MAG: hypothetical protein ABI460_18605 [Caldimonas sp.]